MLSLLQWELLIHRVLLTRCSASLHLGLDCSLLYKARCRWWWKEEEGLLEGPAPLMVRVS